MAARISFEYAQEKIEKFFLRNFYNKAQEFFSNKLIIELMKIFFCLIRLSIKNLNILNLSMIIIGFVKWNKVK